MSLFADAPAPRIEGCERPSDQAFMRQALALARRYLGRTAPNPSVGAVLVDEGGDRKVILARAVTAQGGRPHAERLAIDEAGKRASGATLYVTLEPCAHHGRTPPCAEAVIAAGIARVVCGLEDPDIRVAGKGFALMRRAGIELVTGVMGAECRKAHAGHIMRVTQGRPYVTLKLAMTADGFAARAKPEEALAAALATRPFPDAMATPGQGSRLVISGAVANAQTHLLRARSDAILIGVGTVLADDPELTCRLPGLASRSPMRVVLDTHLRLPPTARIVASARAAPSLIIAGPDASQEAEARLAQEGVEVLRVAVGEKGRLDLHSALRALAHRGVTLLMCEGGPLLADELALHGLIDEAVLITGAHGLAEPGLAATGPSLSQALALGALVPAERLVFGEDRWVRYERSL